MGIFGTLKGQTSEALRCSCRIREYLYKVLMKAEHPIDLTDNPSINLD
jgi:hypothetical protein